MLKKVIGLALSALGVVVMVASMIADVTWFGDKAGFEWLQTLGSAIGFLAVPAGVWLALEKPRSKRTMGAVLIPLGLFVLVISLAADVIVASNGVAIGDREGIGWWQLLGVAIGVITVLVGGGLALIKPSEKK